MTVYRFSVVMLVVASCGCSGGSDEESLPDLAAASGTITMDEKPLAGAIVYFYPTEEGLGSDVPSGFTDEAGKYELKIRAGEDTKTGAVSGQYKVVISRFVKPDGTPVPFDSEEPPAMLGAHESIPLEYSDPAQTKLKATVTGSGGMFDFELKSQ